MNTYGLVMSGGGIGFATHVGVVSALETWDPETFAQFRVLVGTSAGSIPAGLLAAGYTPKQVRAVTGMFAQTALGGRLFDLNDAGALDVLLAQDFTFARGLFRGDGLSGVLQTLLSRSNRPKIQALCEQPPEKAALELLKLLDAQARKAKDGAFYADQINFGELNYSLFILGMNALTGQKTVFCKLEGGERDEQKGQVVAVDRGGPQRGGLVNYINKDEIAAAIAEANRDLPPEDRLNFRRFESRVYTQFDRDLYGPQFPLSLALRSSSSIPGIFEPVRVQRTPAKVDLFVDGGVADNFALDIAAHPDFGDCAHVLGVGLTNLGYRLPNPLAAHTVLDIAVSSLSYMMDALLDQNLGQARRRITVVNALSNQSVSLTNTARIGDLVKEGEAIAAGFRESLEEHITGANLGDAFRLGDGPQIYLSRAAIVGPEAFKDLLKPQPSPTFFQAVFLRPFLTWGGRDRGLWRWIYLLVVACAFTVMSLAVETLTLWGTPERLVQVLAGQALGVFALIFAARAALWGWRSRARRAAGARGLEVGGEASKPEN